MLNLLPPRAPYVPRLPTLRLPTPIPSSPVNLPNGARLAQWRAR